MNFSYDWLQSFFNKKLPKPEKLAELLTMHSFEVSEVKKVGKDNVLDIDVLPNRAPDCFSHAGIAREISAVTGMERKKENYSLKEDKKLKTKDFISVEVKDSALCQRYTTKVILDVKVGPSPKWLKDRLKSCGLQSINNIVDVVNYVMLETGQPLHAFDGEKVESQKIIVRRAKKRERIVTLDEERRELDENTLVIADSEKPLAIAGIKGGKIPEIDKKTKIVVLESANFNSSIIRQGSRNLNLKTDASLRFEHGIDPNLTDLAVKRAAFLIQKIAKGKIAKGLVDVYQSKAVPKIIKLNLDYLESLLGIKVSIKEVKNIFNKLDFKVKGKSRELIVEIPTFRMDINLPEDLIEEVGRIFGYDKIPAQFPTVFLVPPEKNLNLFWQSNVKNTLKEAGLNEVYNYSFINDKDAEVFKCLKKDLVEIENPVSLEQKYLRPSLIPNLLKNVEKNEKYFKEIKIFELGKIFRKANQKKEEKNMLTGVIVGEAFYQAKGVVDALLDRLGVGGIWYDEHEPTPEESEIVIWHPKRRAEIKIDNIEIGFLGEISQKITQSYGIKSKVVIFDIDFEKLSQISSEEHEYRPISRFPSAIRDIAVLVPLGVKVSQVLDKIYEAGGKIIRDVDLFDIYEGEEIPGNKKNLAFHIIYQAEDRTLVSKEIDQVQNRIIKTLEKEPGWRVRK